MGERTKVLISPSLVVLELFMWRELVGKWSLVSCTENDPHGLSWWRWKDAGRKAFSVIVFLKGTGSKWGRDLGQKWVERQARILLFTSLVPNPMLAGPDAFLVLTLTLCYSLACVWHEFNNKNESLLDNTRGISEITDAPSQGTPSVAPGKGRRAFLRWAWCVWGVAGPWAVKSLLFIPLLVRQDGPEAGSGSSPGC